MRLTNSPIAVELTLFCVLTATASAASLWRLQGVTFADGGTATGSFVYDPGTNTYSSIGIITTPGTAFSGTTYEFIDSATSSATGAGFLTSAASDQTGADGLALFYNSSLAGGGTIPLKTKSAEVTCTNANCVNVSLIRTVSAGSVAEAPEPYSMLLFAVALTVKLARRSR